MASWNEDGDPISLIDTKTFASCLCRTSADCGIDRFYFHETDDGILATTQGILLWRRHARQNNACQCR